MSPRVEALQQLVVRDFSSCIRDGEIHACGEKESLDSEANRFDGIYTRDLDETLELVIPHVNGQMLRYVVEAAITTQLKIERYIGTKDDPRTGEKKDLPPHEILQGPRNQKRLKQLMPNFPVNVGADGSLSMHNYFEDDAPSNLRSSYCNVVNGLSRLDGMEVAREYGKRKLPIILASIEFDVKRGDLDGDGLPESDPPPSQAIQNPTYKDSYNAFYDEDGREPVAPRKYLRNCVVFADSLRKSSILAKDLGYEDIAEDLQNRYVTAKQTINEKFWMEDLQYMCPVIDGEGRQIKFIADDVADGLWRHMFDPNKAKIILNRLNEPDIDTHWGPRTRNTQSTQFAENGTKAYHCGTVWGQTAAKLVDGAIYYGMPHLARKYIREDENFRYAMGNAENAAVARDNSRISDYEENGIVVAGRPQTWSAAAGINVLVRHAQINHRKSPIFIPIAA